MGKRLNLHKIITRVAVLTIVFGSVWCALYLQNRSLANDMPTLLATQAAKQLEAGMGTQSINMGGTNLANNPVPFVIVYDKHGKPVAGSGYLDNKLAVAPKSMLEQAKAGKNHTVTWSPKDDVRLATVVVATKDNYVLGGQSLRATEDRAHKILKPLLAGYILSLLLLVAPYFCRCNSCKSAGVCRCAAGGCCGGGECAHGDGHETKPTKAIAKKPSRATKPKTAAAKK
ncbi:MAG: hypothetical protein WAQ24_03865 [Candidatus Saccharimonadales bacterium]